MPLLSVIIPVYNEAKTIRQILEKVNAVNIDKEIIVVDDGSFDGTNRVLRDVQYNNLKVIHHSSNRGKGAAVLTGLARASGEFVIVATTRPELLATCKVILYNPEDERYKHLEGQTAIVPIYRNEVKIMAHPYAKQDFGSGLVMICSFGDYGDVRLLRELDLNPTYAIDDRGRMNKNSKVYQGLKVKEARAKIIEDLKLQGVVERQATITSRQPICWRSKNPVEFIPMKEFYLKQVQFKDDLLKMANEMKFFAPESKQILIDCFG